MNTRERWVQVLTVIGGLSVLFGGLDPLEGSIAVAAGSVLLALAGQFGETEPRVRRTRHLICGAVICGAGALWVLSFAGGVGGGTGRTVAWLVLVLPMLAGWSFTFWAPGAPRWLTAAGVAGGAWYLVLPALVAWKGRDNPNVSWPLLAGLAGFGLLTIGACGWRLGQPAQADLRR